MNFGLPEKTIEQICKFFSTIPEVNEVRVFGSRALGNYEKASDIDLVFITDSEKDLTAHLLAELDELPTPYFFDLKDYNRITNLDLKDHIDRVGKILYKK